MFDLTIESLDCLEQPALHVAGIDGTAKDRFEDVVQRKGLRMGSVADGPSFFICLDPLSRRVSSSSLRLWSVHKAV